MTVARATQGMASSSLRLSAMGTRKRCDRCPLRRRGASLPAQFSKAGGLDVAGPSDAEARVAFEIGFKDVASRGEARETMSAPRARNTRPAVLAGRHQWEDAAPKAPRLERGESSPSGILHFERHAGQRAPVRGTPCFMRRKRDSVGASSSQIRGRDVVLL